MKTGQISIMWLLGIGTSILLAAAGSFTASVSNTNSKVDKVRDAISLEQQRTSRLEADSITIKEDLKEIKADIKALLKKSK